MGSFDAATAVEQLDYDFTAYDADKGVIPEPSTGQMEAYFNEVREIAQRARKLQESAKKMQEREKSGDAMSDEEAQEVLAAMDEFSLAKFQSEMSAAIARLCSDSPSEDQLAKLPHRVLQAFMKWISGEFRPEAGVATTKQ